MKMALSSGGQGVGGSNPLAPTINPHYINNLQCSRFGRERSNVARKAAYPHRLVQEYPRKSPRDVRGAFSSSLLPYHQGEG